MLNHDELSAFVAVTLLGESDRQPLSVDDAFIALSEWIKEGVELPEGITALPQSAFDGCNTLRIIYLPDSLVTVGKWSAAKDQNLYAEDPGGVFSCRSRCVISPTSMPIGQEVEQRPSPAQVFSPG